MSETETVNSVHGKLLAVMRDVKRIPKTGHNSFHGYDYATDQDISEAVGASFRKHGLTIYPSRVGAPFIGPEQTTKDGRKLKSWTYEIDFVVTDPETGDEIRSQFLGQGDESDKSLYKAITGARKYFLLSLLLIPTGDDPERDNTPAPSKKEMDRDRSSGGASPASPGLAAPIKGSLPPSVVCDSCGTEHISVDIKAVPSKFKGKPMRFLCPDCGQWGDALAAKPLVAVKADDDDLPF